MEVKFICCGIFIFTIILAMILAVTIPLMLVKESFTFKYVGENTFNKRRHRLCWQLYESLYKIDSKLTLNKLEGFADKSLANSTDEKFFEFVLYKYFESRSYRSLLLWQHSLEKPLFSWAKIGYWYIPIYIAVFAFIAQGNMKNEIMIGTFTFFDCKEILEALSPILLFFFWQIEQMTTEKRRIAWLKIAKRIEIESTVSNEKKCTIPIVTQKETNTSEHTYVAKIEENEDGYIVTIKNKEEINQ